MRLPPAHPFNPLHALRLVIGAGSTRHAVETALNFVFQQGRDVTDPDVLVDLAKELGIPDARAVIEDQRVKQQLRDNTDWAIAQGVFGVPTFVIDGELFWGHDAFDMVLDYLRDPGQFADAEMRRIDDLPVGVVRTLKQRSD